jgi:hydroxyethylthiazole kinase-like uncharacterized protein yjeF
LPDPFETESKEERGRVLVIGGTRQVPGAAWLAARASLHAGAGKLQVATVDGTAIALAVGLPEAMVMPLPEDPEGGIARLTEDVLLAAKHADAVLLGPGMADGAATEAIVADGLQHADCPVVLDAGAIVAWRPILPLRHPVVVTPHAGEMAAALGCERDAVEADPVGCARKLADRAACIVVMKGVPTFIVAGDDVLEFCVEAPGLGTSGSGDVLAGLIAGLIARGAAPIVAAGWAVWLHGRAGRRLGDRIGPVGYLARDISPEVPALMQDSRKMVAASSPILDAGA